MKLWFQNHRRSRVTVELWYESFGIFGVFWQEYAAIKFTVPGIIGYLQALEAVKISTKVGDALSERMLLLDAMSARIHIVKIRGRSQECEACGDISPLTRQQFQVFDYKNFTQSPLPRLHLC